MDLKSIKILKFWLIESHRRLYNNEIYKIKQIYNNNEFDKFVEYLNVNKYNLYRSSLSQYDYINKFINKYRKCKNKQLQDNNLFKVETRIDFTFKFLISPIIIRSDDLIKSEKYKQEYINHLMNIILCIQP